MSADALHRERNNSRIMAVASGALWVISLALPALSDQLHPTDWSRGWEVAGLGFLGPVRGLWAWYANPLYFVCLVLLLRGAHLRAVLGWSLAAAALALTVLLPARLPIDLSGSAATLIRGPGCWLWLTAVLLPAAGGLWAALRQGGGPAEARGGA